MATNNALNIPTAGLPLYDGVGGFTALPYANTTFTPALKFNATTGITYTTQTGLYTRVGNVVFIGVNIVLSSKGSSTGFAGITGLPFTSSATNVLYMLAAEYLGMAGFPPGTDTPIGIIQASSTQILPFAYGSGAGTISQFGDSFFTNTSTIRFNGFYRI